MRSSSNLLLLVVITTLLFSIGCAGTPVNFPSAGDQDFEKYDETKGRTISASASGFQLLYFIPINLNTRQEHAYDRLLMQAGGDCIADIKIRESWTYAFVGTIYKTTFEATAYPKLK